MKEIKQEKNSFYVSNRRWEEQRERGPYPAGRFYRLNRERYILILSLLNFILNLKNLRTFVSSSLKRLNELIENIIQTEMYKYTFLLIFINVLSKQVK